MTARMVAGRCKSWLQRAGSADEGAVRVANELHIGPSSNQRDSTATSPQSAVMEVRLEC